MRIAYLDCASGISGDMTLGALIDAGVDLAAIQNGIDSLGLNDCHLIAEETIRHGFRATNITVQHPPEHAHRHLHHIHDMIDGSSLTNAQKKLSRDIFSCLGKAEAKVHGTSIEKVHFHEVGAVDSIADVVGSAIGWDLLGVDRVVCSPIPTGSGFIEIAHGRTSVPAPATAELLRGVPLAPSVVEAELTTPTGAAIAVTVCDEFGLLPSMAINTIGLGAGDRDFSEQANLLRLIVGETDNHNLSHSDHDRKQQIDADQVWILEANLDDVPGELIGYCQEQLFAAGALDAFTTAIQMKKNRPGVKLTALCHGGDIQRLEEIFFQETGTLGVRRWPATRHKLQRKTHFVTTPWGEVAGKLFHLPDGTERFSPEFESCRQIAATKKLVLRDVYRAAQHAFGNESG